MGLMARVDHARSGLQAANDRLSAARGVGKPKSEAPKEPEEKGFFDKMIDKAKNASWSDIGHTALDVAGLIPGLGIPADLANAGWYLAEGDKVNAGLSAAGMIPILGEAAVAAKLGVKATKTFRLADNVEESMARANKIRQELGSGKAKNIAFADINVGGRSDTLKADSGPTPRPGGVGLPEKPTFKTFETPPGHRRDLDTEYKILEEISARHADNPKVKGTVSLFTERYPCLSCTGVIEQFQRKFPNIMLDVTHGGRR